MKLRIRTRSLPAVIVSSVAFALLAVGASSATALTGPVTKVFSFIGKAKSKTVTLVNIDSLLINARCNAKGSPVVYAFSSSTNADIFVRVYDGLGRLHLIKNTAFTAKTKGVLLSPTSGDFDSTGTMLFENASGKVVNVSFAFDNSTTLSGLNVCTVFGSVIAT